MRAVALLLLLLAPGWARGQQLDGGVALFPSALDVERGALTLADGGVVDVSGGCWLNTQTCLGLAQELEAKRAQAKAMQGNPTASLNWTVPAFVLGMLAGVGVAYLFLKR